MRVSDGKVNGVTQFGSKVTGEGKIEEGVFYGFLDIVDKRSRTPEVSDRIIFIPVPDQLRRAGWPPVFHTLVYRQKDMRDYGWSGDLLWNVPNVTAFCGLHRCPKMSLPFLDDSYDLITYPKIRDPKLLFTISFFALERHYRITMKVTNGKVDGVTQFGSKVSGEGKIEEGVFYGFLEIVDKRNRAAEVSDRIIFIPVPDQLRQAGWPPVFHTLVYREREKRDYGERKGRLWNVPNGTVFRHERVCPVHFIVDNHLFLELERMFGKGYFVRAKIESFVEDYVKELNMVFGPVEFGRLGKITFQLKSFDVMAKCDVNKPLCEQMKTFPYHRLDQIMDQMERTTLPGCLNFLLTYRFLPDGPGAVKKIGEICRLPQNGRESNFGFVNFYNLIKDGTVDHEYAKYVLSHESGHQLGAWHDQSTTDCFPIELPEDIFLMFGGDIMKPDAGFTNLINRKLLSECSIASITETLEMVMAADPDDLTFDDQCFIDPLIKN
ncbi:metallo-peptidase family m12B reprolysin-like domain-containing protein [Ditylenchus destructor]|uniref:Metallo-peptidase family m12B reprolysin-like domain-containing protein n=1 Tax=Ditylenchus destructor TaxID=166010 RepID=A0AAD4N4U6_9BILA|nr:metallo-peptidase family m12B reprolysin-like domain-containing protein [Ditylenchus destructor]